MLEGVTFESATANRKKQNKAAIAFLRAHWETHFPEWHVCDELEEIFDSG